MSILELADRLKIQYSSHGINYRKCRCFMHDDKHPSMWLKLSNNSWRCPVCDKGGGMIDLIMEHEGLSFKEAKEWLNPSSRFTLRPLNASPRKHPSETSKHALYTLPSSLLARSQSSATVFCQSLINTGFLTATQVEDAVSRYHLGATKDGGVVFWNIDEHRHVREGKIMWYQSDCHRDRHHTPISVSYRLKSMHLLPAEWSATPCLFGLHQIVDDTTSSIAIVESEKTAVICSQLIPSLLWMASGGLSHLQPELLLPLRGRKIILFPDTDTTGSAYKLWCEKAEAARHLLHHPIYVSPLLEQHASEQQKKNKIDIVDYMTL